MQEDWGPVFISLMLFILLSPGLLFQMPGKSQLVDCGGRFQTSASSILVHALLFFAVDALLLVALGIRIHLG